MVIFKKCTIPYVVLTDLTDLPAIYMLPFLSEWFEMESPFFYIGSMRKGLP